MQVTTGLLGLIARGWASFTKSGQSDAQIDVPPVYLNSGMLPQPILRLTTAGTLETWNVSHVVANQSSLGTTTTYAATKLSEGLWDVFWSHFMEVSGGVVDLTAVADLTISVSGLSGSPTISRLRDSLNQAGRSGSFRFSVLKGQEVTISHSITGGAGTSTQFARTFLVCSRLL